MKALKYFSLQGSILIGRKVSIRFLDALKTEDAEE